MVLGGRGYATVLNIKWIWRGERGYGTNLHIKCKILIMSNLILKIGNNIFEGCENLEHISLTKYYLKTIFICIAFISRLTKFDFIFTRPRCSLRGRQTFPLSKIPWTRLRLPICGLSCQIRICVEIYFPIHG